MPTDYLAQSEGYIPALAYLRTSYFCNIFLLSILQILSTLIVVPTLEPWILEQDIDWKRNYVQCYFLFMVACVPFLTYLYLLAQA